MENIQENAEKKNKSSTLIGPYCLIEEIGRGSFATVYLGKKVTISSSNSSSSLSTTTNNNSNSFFINTQAEQRHLSLASSTTHLVAIKSVSTKKLNKKLAENLETEISILKAMQHPNIVALLDLIKSENYIHLVMEYCSLGDLSQYIKKKGLLHGTVKDIASNPFLNPWGGLNEIIVRHFLRQIASAMEFLRSKSLIHRDLKPQNLLLSEPPNYRKDLPQSYSNVTLEHIPNIKIADFGFARALPSQSLASTLCGSPLYMAPEVLRGEKYDAKADLWSIGAVLYELLCGRPPFKAQNHIELLRKIDKGDGIIRFPGERITSSSSGHQQQQFSSASAKMMMMVSGQNRPSPMSCTPPSLSSNSPMGVPTTRYGASMPVHQTQNTNKAYYPIYPQQRTLSNTSFDRQFSQNHSNENFKSRYHAATPDSHKNSSQMSNDLKDLIRGLLKRDRNLRISFEEFFRHQALYINRPLDVTSNNYSNSFHKTIKQSLTSNSPYSSSPSSPILKPLMRRASSVSRFSVSTISPSAQMSPSQGTPIPSHLNAVPSQTIPHQHHQHPIKIQSPPSTPVPQHYQLDYLGNSSSHEDRPVQLSRKYSINSIREVQPIFSIDLPSHSGSSSLSKKETQKKNESSISSYNMQADEKNNQGKLSINQGSPLSPTCRGRNDSQKSNCSKSGSIASTSLRFMSMDEAPFPQYKMEQSTIDYLNESVHESLSNSLNERRIPKERSPNHSSSSSSIGSIALSDLERAGQEDLKHNIQDSILDLTKNLENMPTASQIGKAKLVSKTRGSQQSGVDRDSFLAKRNNNLLENEMPNITSTSSRNSLKGKNSDDSLHAAIANANQVVDYVADDFEVVDKRSVQINWLADEAIASGKKLRKALGLSLQKKSIVGGELIPSSFPFPIGPPYSHLFQFLENRNLSSQSSESSSHPHIDSLMQSISTLVLRAHFVHQLANESFDFFQGSSQTSNSSNISPSHQGSDIFIAQQKETFQLFLLALSLYQLGMDLAKNVWEDRQKLVREVGLEVEKLIEGMQWIRNKFNSCMAAADTLETRIKNSSSLNNPSTTASSSPDQSNSKNQIHRPSFFVLYDKSLGLSKSAAKHELVLQEDQDKISKRQEIIKVDDLSPCSNMTRQSEEIFSKDEFSERYKIVMGGYAQSIIYLDIILASDGESSDHLISMDEQTRANVERLMSKLYMRLDRLKNKLNE